MTYPPAPWYLPGMAFLNANIVSVEKSRAFIPSELEIITILPGQTLGGVYLSSYQTGSVLEYNELIVAPALVRYQKHIGFWISHIYVDSQDSLRGGQKIWGLPKEIAQFTWMENEVFVSQNNHLLCRFFHQSRLLNFALRWLPKLQGNCLSKLNEDLLSFDGQFNAKISFVSVKLEIHSESPFFCFNLEQPFLSIYLNNLNLIINAPQKIN